AEVGQHVGVESADSAGPLAEAVGVVAAFVAVLEQDLHADADAEHVPPAGEAAVDDFGAVHGGELLHDGGEGADPGDDEAVCFFGGAPVGGDGDGGAGVLEGAGGGVGVSAAVVEYDDGGAGAHGCRLTGVASQGALGGGHAGDSGVAGDGVSECAGEGFELGFRDVVG